MGYCAVWHTSWTHSYEKSFDITLFIANQRNVCCLYFVFRHCFHVLEETVI